jgi:hypothetical protein
VPGKQLFARKTIRPFLSQPNPARIGFKARIDSLSVGALKMKMMANRFAISFEQFGQPINPAT